VPARRLTLLTLLLALAIAPPAMAGGTLKTASFTARVSGTYKATGTVTNTQCRRLDAEGNPVTYTATATATETTSFTTTRGMRFDVSRTQGQSRLGGGGFPIPIRATMKRASGLDETTEPKGCNPGGFPLRPNCGTKRKPYKLSVYSVRRGGPGFAYNFSSGFSTTRPDDPFTCPLPENADWFGQVTPPTAKVSAARLFGRGRTIVTSASVTRHPRSAGTGYTSEATETLTWKLTLTRR